MALREDQSRRLTEALQSLTSKQSTVNGLLASCSAFRTDSDLQTAQDLLTEIDLTGLFYGREGNGAQIDFYTPLEILLEREERGRKVTRIEFDDFDEVYPSNPYHPTHLKCINISSFISECLEKVHNIVKHLTLRASGLATSHSCRKYIAAFPSLRRSSDKQDIFMRPRMEFPEKDGPLRSLWGLGRFFLIAVNSIVSDLERVGAVIDAANVSREAEDADAESDAAE